jgi:serine phosphatase RsbU (regulator of sigma subunit)
LAAAAIMASLRYTIRAYASLAYSPARILEMASKEINIGSDGHFATVLVGLADNERREVTMASAGHLPALLLNDSGSEFVTVPVGLPLGIGAPAYEVRTIPITPNSTLIAYTDGLIERRSEGIDTGMERLRKAASQEAPSVDDLVANIVSHLLAGRVSYDDTAILAIRWLH